MLTMTPDTYITDARLDRFYRSQLEAGWANESDGQTDAPTGYFALIINLPAEKVEIEDALGDELATEGLTFEEVVGFVVIVINSAGIIIANRYPTRGRAAAAYRRLESDYRDWEHDGSECTDYVCLTRHRREFVAQPIDDSTNLHAAMAHITGDWYVTEVGDPDTAPGWLFAIEVGVGSRKSWDSAQGMPDVDWLRTNWNIEAEFDINAKDMVGYWTVLDRWVDDRRYQCILRHPDSQSMTDAVAAHRCAVTLALHRAECDAPACPIR